MDSGCAVARRVAHLLTAIPSSLPDEGTGLAYCSRLDAQAQKLDSPFAGMGLSSLEEVEC